MKRRAFIKQGALFVPALFIPRLVKAQNSLLSGTFQAGVLGTTNLPSGGGGGGSAYSFVVAAQGAGANPTSSSVNTTGAKLIVISLSWFSSTSSVSDNKGNTWTALTQFSSGGAYLTQLFYCINPTVGAGHTFSATANLAVINVFAFSYTGTTPAYDTPNQNGVSVTTNLTSFQTGSVTPTGNNELFITGATYNDTGADVTASINSSFIGLQQLESGTRSQFYGAMAYKIQTTGGAENPTWSFSGTVNTASAAIAIFK